LVTVVTGPFLDGLPSSTSAPSGNVSPRTTFGDRVMKVNHAGENGAIHIYTGQIFMARVRARPF
jgi:demethoxyubiquinone hydroxylase (CLK1/Coq7/Cat5 family)